MTFTARVTLQIAALVTGTTIVVLLAVDWMLERQITQSMEFMQELEAHELSKSLGNDQSISRAELTERIERDVERDTELYYIQVHNEKGVVLFRSRNLIDTILPDLTYTDDQGTQSRTMTIPPLGPLQISEFYRGPWHIQIASPIAPMDSILKNFASVSGLLVVAVGIISMGLGYAFSRVVLQPLRSIEQTAHRIRGDNLSERIPILKSRDELSALSVLLNQMFDRLETSFDQIQRFTADVSHELKTPLALIRLNAERLRPHIASDSEASVLLGDLLDAISRLNQVIESLLFIAKAESGALALDLQKCDIGTFLAPFSEDAQMLATDRGVTFLCVTGSKGEAHLEPNLMRQLLLNLLSNALNVSQRGSTITLETTQTSAGWRFVMMDEGPGVPTLQLQRIFERFVRYDKQPGANRGHGLGLAICQTIVSLHGGTIHAENRTDRSGLRMVIEWPA